MSIFDFLLILLTLLMLHFAIIDLFVLARAFFYRRNNKFINGNGYVEFIIPYKQFSKYEHRMLVEQYFGRRLEWYEEVHHINGKRNDNSLSNFCLLTKRSHRRYHSWYSYIVKNYKVYPKSRTQMKKLSELGAIFLD